MDTMIELNKIGYGSTIVFPLKGFFYFVFEKLIVDNAKIALIGGFVIAVAVSIAVVIIR